MNPQVSPAADDTIDFVTAAPAPGSLEVAWSHGSRSRRRPGDPAIQVHRYDEHTIIMRQSKSVSYEAPFMYLLFGNQRALLLDTGATADSSRFPLRATVDELITGWLAKHPRDDYELVVAHSHGHNDHVAADGQFAGRPDTTVVPRDAGQMREFFGFGDAWPAQAVTFDLGGRILDVLGSPGHHKAAVTVYDRWTGILLTGDTVLPGRLFAFDFAAYQATLDRLVEFAAARPVSHVLGCHIEMMRKPGRDYPVGATYQPGERVLEMTTGQLGAIRDAAASVATRRGVYRFDDFAIYNEPRPIDLLRMLARGWASRLVGALRLG
jgi:hydroxyacylglutathione hydrolase